jgi:peptide-methionine (S)-S-oxide reductase
MRRFLILLIALSAAGISACYTARAAATIPDPTVDEQLATAKGEKTAVVAGGCFWGIQAVFQHVKGVKAAWSGYSGGAASTAEYETVSTGRTGHAESVQIIYDPSQITYGQLLKIFFSVAHDPTELNRQGPDEGTQYRSAIFFANEEQHKIAAAYINQLNEAKAYRHKIVTEVSPLKAFYRAEDYHQDYVAHNPGNPYVMFNDLPKLTDLKKQFPDLYKK